MALCHLDWKRHRHGAACRNSHVVLFDLGDHMSGGDGVLRAFPRKTIWYGIIVSLASCSGGWDDFENRK